MKFNLFCILFFFKVNAFQDCLIDENNTSPIFLLLNKCESIAFLDFTYHNLIFVNYDFQQDSCSFERQLAVYSPELIISLTTIKKYRTNPSFFHPDCVPYNATYLRDNVWIIPPTEIGERLKSSYVRELYSSICSMDRLVLNMIGNVDTRYVRHFYRQSIHERDGFDFLVKKNNVLKFECTQKNITRIVRTKQIGDICYEKIPVIVDSKTMFSTNGIDLLHESKIVECPTTTNLPTQQDHNITKTSMDFMQMHPAKRTSQCKDSFGFIHIDIFILGVAIIVFMILIGIIVVFWLKVRKMNELIAAEQTFHYHNAKE
uniref:Recep_L_domain domain-containing protein n=1 Tax=Rhabditophanes sp. KR3021 TaxID=114890 RepID=A0AC35UEK1_9BILA